MLIEVRWESRGEHFQRADVVMAVLGEDQLLKFLGMTLNLMLSYPAAYDGIGAIVPNWLEYQTKFEHSLIPELKRMGVKDPAIYIEGRPIGAWLAELEQRYILLREDAHSAVAALKQTRRFFRNKYVEAVRRKLEITLAHFCAGAPSRPIGI